MPFILLGNIASSLKFELISRKIGLVFCTMELDTRELFRCLAHETLFTHRRSNIYLHKLPFTVDLTDIKSWIIFKFH